MYRAVGIVVGGGCTVPSECVQAAKYYPQHMNVGLVHDYCAWEAQGKGGEVEKMCLQAIMAGQAPVEQPPTQKPGSECDSDSDCDGGICDAGFCSALPMEPAFTEPMKWLGVLGLGIAGTLVYYFSRSTG